MLSFGSLHFGSLVAGASLDGRFELLAPDLLVVAALFAGLAVHTNPPKSKRDLYRTAGFAFAFTASPIVGAVFGAIGMSWVMPNESILFSIRYALVGGAAALVFTLLMGPPLYLFASGRGHSLAPLFFGTAMATGLVVALGLPCVLMPDRCKYFMNHSIVFGLLCSVTTAALLVGAFRLLR